MKAGLRRRKKEEMVGVIISETMISLKISRGNEYLFDELNDEVNETGVKSRNRLIENILIEYFEEKKARKRKMLVAEYSKNKNNE